jgi:anti-sigma regulatory factor (Ser/Thr protein kinase)
MSHQWETFIHGKILTRLAATSLKLEQAVSNNDTESFEAGLKNIGLVLEDPTREFEQNLVDLKSEISSRLDPWDGLIVMKISIDAALENVSNERVHDLGEVIEEIISNSVRHGGSQNISINISSSIHPDIHVQIEDDAFKYIEAIIHSMTPKERTKPAIIDVKRKTRIAKGSGTKIEQVNQLMKQFEQMSKMMKMMQGPGGKNMMKMMGNMKGMSGMPGMK